MLNSILDLAETMYINLSANRTPTTPQTPLTQFTILVNCQDVYNSMTLQPFMGYEDSEELSTRHTLSA